MSAKDDEQLTERLRSLQTFTDRRPSGIFGSLGYRGFSISREADHALGPMALTVHEGIADRQIAGPNMIETTGIEDWLAEQAASHVSPEVMAYVREAIARKVSLAYQTATKGAACPPCKAADAPAYDPSMWNVPNVQPYNNCYNYANNQITSTFAQPGRATGHMYTAMTCASVQPAAQSDGLVSCPNFTASLGPGQGWYVALVVWPNNDYHWYRQDNVGCWSHKPGPMPVRNYDNAGQPITDPKTCDRGPYTDFCSYMVTNRNVHIH
ncbi:MAG: hypothetical protein P8Z80_14925 [Pseudolabrys sp.]